MATNASTVPHSAADRAWYAAQVELLLPELYGTARRLAGNETEAEDLVAEAVAKGWAALASLTDRTAVRAWLFRILNNLWISRWRSARGQAVHESLDATDEEPFSLFDRLHRPVLLWGGNPELEFLNRMLRADLARAIDALPDPFRSVVVLVDIQGLAYREVADLLDVPVGTVRSRLARGRSQLQEQLWQHAVEAGLRPPSPNHTEDEHDE
ncbi:MAG TPA: sigma-70 family RNA polymerase sigma factor [Longimicrobiales bacterium]|nr:sigma-70 family RNA polymerase sigma factor [Longimicrobiales bacterium]